MSDPNAGSDPNQSTTEKPIVPDIRISDEDIKRLEQVVKPQTTTPAIKTDETDYKAKYEQLASERRAELLGKLPEKLAKKYKEASYDQLLILADAVNATGEKPTPLSRDGEAPVKPTKEDEGYIGGKNLKTGKYE